uniref:Uncharacterized protein n=1 Tax=Lepeophtheirus salmonis TaxID=72036 RepID=A0A0K2TEL0_LEPSM
MKQIFAFPLMVAFKQPGNLKAMICKAKVLELSSEGHTRLNLSLKKCKLLAVSGY